MNQLIINKQQAISSLLGEQKYIDTRVTDSNFIKQVIDKTKKALPMQCLYHIDDQTLNQNLPSLAKIYYELSKFKEWREFMPTSYQDSSLKKFVAILLNSTSGMAFELALLDLNRACLLLANKLNSSDEELVENAEQDCSEELLKRSQAFSKSHQTGNHFKVKRYEKAQLTQGGSKRLKGLESVDVSQGITTTRFKSTIDLSANAASTILSRKRKLRDGTYKDDEMERIVRQLYHPLKYHTINKELATVKLQQVAADKFSLSLTFEIFHTMKHVCVNDPEAATYIRQLQDEDVKFILTHNMESRTLSQRRSYVFTLHDPSLLAHKLPIKDFTLLMTPLMEVRLLEWQPSDTIFDLVYPKEEQEEEEKSSSSRRRLKKQQVMEFQVTSFIDNDAKKQLCCIFCQEIFLLEQLTIFNCKHCCCVPCCKQVKGIVCAVCGPTSIRVTAAVRSVPLPIKSIVASENNKQTIMEQLTAYQKYFAFWESSQETMYDVIATAHEQFIASEEVNNLLSQKDMELESAKHLIQQLQARLGNNPEHCSKNANKNGQPSKPPPAKREDCKSKQEVLQWQRAQQAANESTTNTSSITQISTSTSNPDVTMTD